MSKSRLEQDFKGWLVGGWKDKMTSKYNSVNDVWQQILLKLLQSPVACCCWKLGFQWYNWGAALIFFLASDCLGPSWSQLIQSSETTCTKMSLSNGILHIVHLLRELTKLSPSGSTENTVWQYKNWKVDQSSVPAGITKQSSSERLYNGHYQALSEKTEPLSHFTQNLSQCKKKKNSPPLFCTCYNRMIKILFDNFFEN